MHRVLIFAGAIATAQPAAAQPDIQKGLEGAIRGCETWVLNPQTWADGPEAFVAAVGLGPQMGLVDRVEAVNLPPASMRVANRYWRINSTAGAGFVLVVSHSLPMCHITGGGDTDMQPIVASVLASPAFKSRWILINESRSGDMATARYRSVEEPRFSMAISRGGKPGERLDRVQVTATAVFDTAR